MAVLAVNMVRNLEGISSQYLSHFGRFWQWLELWYYNSDIADCTIITQSVELIELYLWMRKGGRKLEGIKEITDDGTVVCTDHSVMIMREVLGYECKELKPDEAEKKWKELTTAYKKLIEKYEKRGRIRNQQKADAKYVAVFTEIGKNVF